MQYCVIRTMEVKYNGPGGSKSKLFSHMSNH
jgi:hypothetical protein